MQFRIKVTELWFLFMFGDLARRVAPWSMIVEGDVLDMTSRANISKARCVMHAILIAAESHGMTLSKVKALGSVDSDAVFKAAYSKVACAAFSIAEGDEVFVAVSFC